MVHSLPKRQFNSRLSTTGINHFHTWPGIKIFLFFILCFFLPFLLTVYLFLTSKFIHLKRSTKFGQSLIDTNDGCIGFEICEELFTAKPPHIDMFLGNAEIIINNSSSYFELGKLSKRVKFMKSATLKCGGIYVYGNQRGCDGDRLYFDGSPMILSNGRVLAIGMQFSLSETEVITASVDIDEVRMYRSSISGFYDQSNSAPSFNHIFVNFDLRTSDVPQTDPVIIEYLKPEDETK
ncbi:putative glutamine-dependent NAD(+) synthetase [Smittium mucronatum]|uniref:NAD(+) synthase [glutamine-hydrolyzing] n=1 Tax=Smittium mucronatum TaxID=133383 RepID=A0A1R0H4V8_9FUNG|nr:putative glutamine-dependent NAD(+) synthetase [Smittium mucronatum]